MKFEVEENGWTVGYMLAKNEDDLALALVAIAQFLAKATSEQTNGIAESVMHHARKEMGVGEGHSGGAALGRLAKLMSEVAFEKIR